MGKENKSTSEKSNKSNKTKNAKKFWFGILGIGIAIVFASMAYSCGVVGFGTTTLTPKLFLLPQVIFMVLSTGYIFYKAFSNFTK